MFALGLLSWIYDRLDRDDTSFLEKRFAKMPDIGEANVTAFKAGWNFGETTEAFAVQYKIKQRRCPPGSTATSPATWPWPTGWWPVGAVGPADLPGHLPDHPGLRRAARAEQAQAVRDHHVPGRGRDRRHRRRPRCLVRRIARRHQHVRSRHRAEVGDHRAGRDDRAAAGRHRRAARRPSTGLPTKTEQADLLQAMFGRNGESPVPIVAPQSPGDCFDAGVEAIRIAVTYRTPVMLLSDGMLANGSEPWHIPDIDDCRRSTPPSPPAPTTSPWTRTATPARTSGPTCATRTPSPGHGPSPEPRARAPHRRPGEGRRARQHLLRPGQPRLHGPHPPGQGRPDRRLAAAVGGRRPVRAGKGAGAGLGLDVRPDRRSVPPGAQGRASTSPRCTCATSTRSPTTSARSSRGTTP